MSEPGSRSVPGSAVTQPDGPSPSDPEFRTGSAWRDAPERHGPWATCVTPNVKRTDRRATTPAPPSAGRPPRPASTPAGGAARPRRGHRPLDLPAVPVAPFTRLDPRSGDVRDDASFTQPGRVAGEGVRLVRAELFRSATAWPAAEADGGCGADQCLRGLVVVSVRPRDGDGRRNALSLGRYTRPAAPPDVDLGDVDHDEHPSRRPGCPSAVRTTGRGTRAAPRRPGPSVPTSAPPMAKQEDSRGKLHNAQTAQPGKTRTSA